jgi:glycosyltransferase involved in cell wall biosynthesis
MNIWLLTIGEPVPTSKSTGDRLHRTGSFGRYLSSRGHRVVWWTSAFDHFHKTHFTPGDASITDQSGMKIRLLDGGGYRRNVSISRFVDHAKIARKFTALSGEEPIPDILVSALPTVEMCLAAEAYGARNGVPAVVDLRDMWPDVFADAVHGSLRWCAQTLLGPMYRQSRRACANATALIGITDAFVEWGLQRGGRPRGELDRAFPFAYDPEVAAPALMREAEEFWDAHGIRANGSELIVCYFGNVGRQIDLTHVLQSAQQLQSSKVPVRFVLCGSGEQLENYRRGAAGLSNVLLPGWVNRAQILTLMRRSSIGLDPLRERFDFLATVNNKAVEYLSAGLAVISSPKYGTLSDLLANSGCGVSYPSGDAAALTAHLVSLAGHREEVKRMSTNALALFNRQFSFDVVYPSMENHLGLICMQHQRLKANRNEQECLTSV